MSSFIPKQPKKDRDQITIKLDRDVLENLERYCRYLDSSRDYVINQCLVFIFRKDRQFHEWAAANGQTSTGSAARVATK
jgi:predicted transcriptional regulator